MMRDMSQTRSRLAYVLMAAALPLAVAAIVLAWADESLPISITWTVTLAAWYLLAIVQARRMRGGREADGLPRGRRARIVFHRSLLTGSIAIFGLFVVAVAQHWEVYLALRLLYLALITLAELLVSFRSADRPS